MRETTPGKATDALRQIMSRAAHETPTETSTPNLQLRADAPILRVDETTPVGHLLAEISAEKSGALVVQPDRNTTPVIALSLDRYLELVSKELAGTVGKVATLDGRLVPADEAFALAHVEQVDPQATWKQYGDAR